MVWYGSLRQHMHVFTNKFCRKDGVSCASLSSTLMSLSRQTIYSDCAPNAAGILHLMRCAQRKLRRNSSFTINWTTGPFLTYIIVGFFPHKLRKGCTPPLLTKYTGDSWVMELLRHTKYLELCMQLCKYLLS